jgi:hypothetical protein
MWRIGRVSNSIPIYLYIQQDATLHSLFISGNCSTCFGWYLHPSSWAHTTVSTVTTINKIQQDATVLKFFKTLLFSPILLYMFRALLCPSSGASIYLLLLSLMHGTMNLKFVSTVSGICHAVTGICRYRGRVGTGFSVLWLAYATHSTLKPVPTLPR